MSQVDKSAAGKRARTDGARREDDWKCPSCGNVNFSFRMTCNMRNCTQSRPAGNNAKPDAKSLQPPPPSYTAAGYMGSGAPSSLYLGGPQYGSPLFNGSPLPPYDLPFSGGSGYTYDCGNRLSVGSPYGSLHVSGPPPYSGGSMFGPGGMYGMPPPPMDPYGMGMPMRACGMGPRPGPFPDEGFQKKNAGVGHDSDWTCPKCGNKNYSFRTVCNMRKCDTPRPATEDSKSEISINSKPKIPEGSWKCEKCDNINYPFRTKCNRQNCGAERPAETNKAIGIAPEDNQVGTGHNGRIVGSSSAFDPPADRQVMSWLLNSMQHSLNQSLLFLNDAKEMWNKIENVSKRNYAARVFQLREELRLCNQGETSFSEYYASLCKLWEELMFCRPPSSCCPRGALEQRKQAEEDRIFDLLSGLNPQYSNIREQILSQATLPPLHDVYSMLNEGCPEMQQEFLMHPSLIDSEWFSLDSESQSQIQGCCACECAFSGDGCVSGGSKQQEKCARCGQFGHLKDSCWHLFGQSTHCLSTIAKSRIADNSDCTPDSSVSTRTAESPHFESEIQINDIECMLQQLNCM